MHRKAFTLVEIMIVILIIGILLAIAVPQFITARQSSQLNSCLGNQSKLNSAKQIWAMDYQLGLAAVPTMGDLVPEYLKFIPRCPTGGVYVLGSGNVAVTCSKH